MQRHKQRSAVNRPHTSYSKLAAASTTDFVADLIFAYKAHFVIILRNAYFKHYVNYIFIDS